MPHSTGGGSRSGGYSSSSSRSSYSSGGGSRSSGYSSSSYSSSSYSSSSYSGRSSYSGSSNKYRSSSTSYKAPKPEKKPRVSEKNFTGADRYVYYRDNTPHYVYTNYKPETYSPNYRRLWKFVPFLIILLIGFYQVFQPVNRLDRRYDHEIYIEDALGEVNDEAALRTAMQAFYEETGITPAVVMVHDSEWSEHYTELENLAFEMYVNTFGDECHWLLVYSETDEQEDGFVYWEWQGIAGNDTGEILTDEKADSFGMILQKYLTASSRYTTGEAFTMAFNEFTPTALQAKYIFPDDVPLVLTVIAGYVLIALACSGFFKRKPKKPSALPEDAVYCKKDAAEIKCEYCDGVYLSDLVKCPHCGAPRTKPVK